MESGIWDQNTDWVPLTRRIVWPEADFRAALRALLERDPVRGASTWWEAFVHQTSFITEILLGKEWAASNVTSGTWSPFRGLVRVVLAEEPPTAGAMEKEIRGLPKHVLGCLYLGTGGWEGWAWAALRSEHGTVETCSLYLPGAGMHEVNGPEVAPRAGTENLERYSRTIGAMGGEAIWNRWRQLRFAVVGAGRTGSLVVDSLCRMSVPLTLIDADTIEEHNLTEMAMVGQADLGCSKVDAITSRVASVWGSRLDGPHLPVAVESEVMHPRALALLKDSDVIIATVDNDAARLLCGLVSKMYHKVLLDIGTGIHINAAGQRTKGADVRLILPGLAQPCLKCLGNLRDYPGAVHHLAVPQSRLDEDEPTDWRQHRAGSLRSLNMTAAGIGLGLLEDLVSERIAQSTWILIDYQNNGEVVLRSHQGVMIVQCPLCLKAGYSDFGFGAHN